MSEDTWYHHVPFKKHLSRNESNNSYYVVEEYDAKKFKILSFKDVDTFIQQLSINDHSKSINKCYYNIFFHQRRHLYLDFDIYLEHDMNENNIYSFGKEIIRILVNFYNIHTSNDKVNKKSLTLEDFYIFNSSRSGIFQKQAKQFAFKMSLHIYCCKIVFDNLLLLKNHLSILKQFAHSYRNHFTFPCEMLDLEVWSFNCIDSLSYKHLNLPTSP